MIHERKKELGSLIQDQCSNISGLVILRGKQLEYEYYAEGYTPNSAIHVASVTKSVVSALIGIAIQKGAIKSIDDQVLDYFPFYKLKRGEKTIQKITIRNLLTMTAPYKYKFEPYTKVYSSDDWTTAALNLLGGKGEIGQFKYTTVGIQVLSGIISNATKQSTLNFANENLFKPLGIVVAKNIGIRNKDSYLSFIKKDVPSGWVVDSKGANTAGWGLTLTTSDMAKIGQLYLNKGMWGNCRIISADWINESVSQQSLWGNRSYGFLWWVLDGATGTYAAIGDSGNIIYVAAEKEMVVAISSQFMPRAKDRIEFIKTHIEPFI